VRVAFFKLKTADVVDLIQPGSVLEPQAPVLEELLVTLLDVHVHAQVLAVDPHSDPRRQTFGIALALARP
jgi:hypothetical protein